MCNVLTADGTQSVCLSVSVRHSLLHCALTTTSAPAVSPLLSFFPSFFLPPLYSLKYRILKDRQRERVVCVLFAVHGTFHLSLSLSYLSTLAARATMTNSATMRRAREEEMCGGLICWPVQL